MHNQIIECIDASKRSYSEFSKSSNQTKEGNFDSFDRLPDELVVVIVNKLDGCETLCRFVATCTRFLQLLPQIRSLSTSLPFSVLKSEKSLIWYTCLSPRHRDYLQCLSEFIDRPSFIDPIFRRAYIIIVIYKYFRLYNCNHNWVQYVEDAYKNSVSNSRLFERFTSLDSLVVTLETPSSEACYIGHGSPWFRWDAEIYDSAKPKGYIVIVLGNVVEHGSEGEQIADGSNIAQLYKALTHVLFHWSTARLLLSKARTNVRSIVTKDAGNDGKLRLYRSHEQSSDEASPSKSLEKSWSTGPKSCIRFCYATTPLKVNESLETAIGDLIGACLGFDQMGRDDDQKELKYTVMNLLTAEKSPNLASQIIGIESSYRNFLRWA